MRFSVWPINQQGFDAVRDVIAHVERTGWDGAWMADHLMAGADRPDRPVLEAWTALGALAATTTRLRLGTLVASNTFRHPGVVAKMVATLDEIAPGRIVLGLGAGWQQNEHDAFGLELPPPAHRLQALDEACTVIRRLLDDGTATYDGRHYRLAKAQGRPSPATRVPLLLGLKGDHALKVVARHADEWNLWASPSTLAERRRVLVRRCEQVGRDPNTIHISAQALLVPDDLVKEDRLRWERSGLPILGGAGVDLLDQIGEYARAGLDELVVPDFALGTGAAKLEALDRFLEQVAPVFG